MANNGQSLKTHNTFVGGISPFEKLGIDGSCHFSSHTNLHDDPSYITPMPKPARVADSEGVVTDLIKWMVDGAPYNSYKYAYGDSGRLYAIVSSDYFTLLQTVSGGAGQGLVVFDNYLYVMTSTSIDRYGPLDGTPTYNTDFLSDGATNVDQSATATGKTYTIPGSISESATALRSFTPATDPIVAIMVSINTVGTGDITLTLHDSKNTVLGTSTVVHANLATGFIKFAFSGPIRQKISNQYHFHLTVSTGTSKVDTSTASDLSTGAYKTLNGILLADTNWHIGIEFLSNMVITHKNYVATWDGALYIPNKLTLHAGYSISCMTKIDEYIIIGAYKGNDVTTCTDARIYFWDGVQDTYNYMYPVSMGMPQWVTNKFNKLVGMYGSSGSLCLGSSPFQQIQPVPTLASNAYVAINP